MGGNSSKLICYRHFKGVFLINNFFFEYFFEYSFNINTTLNKKYFKFGRKISDIAEN